MTHAGWISKKSATKFFYGNKFFVVVQVQHFVKFYNTICPLKSYSAKGNKRYILVSYNRVVNGRRK